MKTSSLQQHTTLMTRHYIASKVLYTGFPNPWWRHQIETFSALLALCAENSPVTGEFPAQRPVTRSFYVFFDLCLNKRLSKQCCGWWFETPSNPSWRHCNGFPRCCALFRLEPIDITRAFQDNHAYIDGSVQYLQRERNGDTAVLHQATTISISIEMLQSCTKPSIYPWFSENYRLWLANNPDYRQVTQDLTTLWCHRIRQYGHVITNL